MFKCLHTAIIGEMCQFVWFQSLSQRPHSPLAAEEHMSTGAQSAQLLHAPLFGPPVLEPDLYNRKERMNNVFFKK